MCVSNTPPNWPDVELHPRVLREAASGRLVLWVPHEGEGDVWLRVSSAPQTAAATAATPEPPVVREGRWQEAIRRALRRR